MSNREEKIKAVLELTKLMIENNKNKFDFDTLSDQIKLSRIIDLAIKEGTRMVESTIPEIVIGGNDLIILSIDNSNPERFYTTKVKDEDNNNYSNSVDGINKKMKTHNYTCIDIYSELGIALMGMYVGDKTYYYDENGNQHEVSVLHIKKTPFSYDVTAEELEADLEYQRKQKK